MREQLMKTINSNLYACYGKNKRLFLKWFFIRSKWYTTLIQRGLENDNERKERNIRTLRKWLMTYGQQENWEGKGWIYALTCTESGNWYIGSTKQTLEERLKEHIYESGRVWEKDKMERTAIHKCMWRTKNTNWIIIPLFKTEEERQLRTIERNMIKKLKPNLNRQMKMEKEKKRERKRPCKRERERNKNNTKGREKELKLWKWTVDNLETINFEDVIQKERKLITWEKGNIDCTNWKNLKESFRIEVKIGDDFGGMNFMKKEMKKREMGTMKIIAVTRKDRIWEEKIRRETKEKIQELTDDELVKYWRKRSVLKKGERTTVTKRLNKEMERRKGRPFPKNLNIRVPKYENMRREELYRHIHRWIQDLNCTYQWKKLLKEEIKIIIIRNKTVGEMLLNYREWTKKNWFQINKCACIEKKENGRDEASHEI